MNILIVSHQFYPLNSPRAFRWKSIYDDLKNKGHTVKIITGTFQEKSNDDIFFIGNQKSKTFINNVRTRSNQVDSNKMFINFIYLILKKVYRLFYKTFAWPDYSMFWLYSVWKNRKRIDYQYDVIISVSLPFSSHLAAYILNKKNQKKWIMDIGDPFSLKENAYENNKYLYKYLNFYIEKKFYNIAHQIIFTHKESSDSHIKYFKINKEKIYIGSPISTFNDELFEASKSYKYNTLPIKLGYFGVLTKGVRSPENTLKFFKNSDFEFNWYTNPDSKLLVTQNKINLDNHKFFDMVSRDEALDKMTSSLHCLLSIGNLNPGQLPSKIIEYISTGKPVIHFAEIDDDPVIQISKQFNNLIIVNTDSNLPELEDKLNKIFLNIDTFNKETFIKNYSAGAITSNLDIL